MAIKIDVVYQELSIPNAYLKVSKIEAYENSAMVTLSVYKDEAARANDAKIYQMTQWVEMSDLMSQIYTAIKEQVYPSAQDC